MSLKSKLNNCNHCVKTPEESYILFLIIELKTGNIYGYCSLACAIADFIDIYDEESYEVYEYQPKKALKGFTKNDFKKLRTGQIDNRKNWYDEIQKEKEKEKE